MRVLLLVSSCNVNNIIFIDYFFIANNILHPVIINSNDEARLVINTISYQEESVKPLHYFNIKSEFALPTFQISSNIIEDEPDHINEPVVINNSTLELVCVAPQFSNVINSASFTIQVEEREEDSWINKDTDNHRTETETNENNNN